MRKALEIGGLVSAVVLIGFGIAAIVIGMDGRSTVRDNLKQEKIVGSEDMNPAAIKKEAQAAGLPSSVDLPSCTVAGQLVDNGSRARCFAAYMRIHALESTSGLAYSQMPRFASADGKGTNEESKALKGSSGRPLDNPIRGVWITETALATALNTSYMAERISVFGIVSGIAFLLTGVGFAILTFAGALRNPDTSFKFLRKSDQGSGSAPPQVN